MATKLWHCHYSDVTMGAMAYQITGVLIVCSTVCSDADQRPVNFPHKGPVTRKIFPFDDVIMYRFLTDVIHTFEWKRCAQVCCNYKNKDKMVTLFCIFQLAFLSQSVVHVMPMFCMNMIRSGMPRPRACVEAVRYMHAKRCYICMFCQNGWHASILNFDQHMMSMHVAVYWKKKKNPTHS